MCIIFETSALVLYFMMSCAVEATHRISVIVLMYCMKHVVCVWYAVA